MGKRLIAILLVFAASLPAAGSVWLLCQDGSLHTACCCAAEKTSIATDGIKEEPQSAQIHRADCCTLTQATSPPVLPVTGVEEFQLSGKLVDVEARFVWKADFPVISAPVRVTVPSESARCQTGPPRFVAHCAWLI